MEHTAPTSAQPTPPDSTQDRPTPGLPARLAALLYVVRVLLGHGRRLAETVPDRAATVEFASLAAVFGTYSLSTILARVQRGILRAMALERYLLARGARGHEIAFVDPRPRAPAKMPAEPREAGPSPDPQDERIPKRRPFDPDDLRIPTPEELDAEVRRRPVGRTVAAICMDLAVIPGFCTGDFWNLIFDTLRGFGGSLTVVCEVRAYRE